jgi:hypothetical protein
VTRPVFGTITEGLEVVEKLQNDDVLLKITIIEQD